MFYMFKFVLDIFALALIIVYNPVQALHGITTADMPNIIQYNGTHAWVDQFNGSRRYFSLADTVNMLNLNYKTAMMDKLDTISNIPNLVKRSECVYYANLTSVLNANTEMVLNNVTQNFVNANSHPLGESVYKIFIIISIFALTAFTIAVLKSSPIKSCIVLQYL